MSYKNYFQSYNHYFWQWEEDMEVIAIPQANTIAYRRFITDVVEKMSPQGLPPFGALLLAIIATNPNGSSSIDVINEILKITLKNETNTIQSEAISFLKLLSEIPQPYKEGKKRILLFIALFQECHGRLSVKDAIHISEWCRSDKWGQNTFTIKEDFNHEVFSKDFRTIGLLNGKFQSVNNILSAIATLPEIPEEIINLEENIIEKKESGDLVDQLINNYKTVFVGSLIKRIWSGLNIPVHSSLPSQQPIGGISDLTNKGDFDKLLISEFANEDIIFLSRLANNEALYIHREIPPANNSLQRIILIDVSLKNWGTPKTLAFAIMLAIAKHPKTNIECKAFAVGNSVHPISFESVDNIIDALQLLDGSLNAATGLDSFFKEFPATKNREVFIITESSTIKQVPMLKMMNKHHADIQYWIHPDAEGNIDIYKKQQNSKRHIQHIQLPLEEIWSKQKVTDISRNERKRNGINYPILLKNSIKAKKIMSTSDGEIFEVTNNKKLLRFYNKSAKRNEKGWEIIYDNLPFATGEFEMGLLENGHRILLIYNLQNKMITLLNIDTDEKITVPFLHWKSTPQPGFFFHEQKFYHKNSRGTFSIDVTGEIQENVICDEQVRLDRAKVLTGLLKNYSGQSSSFKNVNEIFINESGNLVFNIHELYINKEFHIKLDQTTKRTKIKSAYKNDHNEFMFDDGSTIEVNSSGILILKSSNELIPVIYIPSAIDQSLGVATESEFAGNMFYYKNPQFDLKLVHPGGRRISIIQLVKEATGLGLKETDTLVNSWPCMVLESASHIKCETLKTALEKKGANVEMHRSQKGSIQEQEINDISARLFYKDYIESFIQHIQSHETKN